MSDAPAARRRVVMGKVGAPYGVKGWVRIFSTAEPPESIFDYSHWQLGQRGQWSTWTVADWRRVGGAFAAQLCAAEGGVPGDRDAAAQLTHSDIAVGRDELPELENDEYYWIDLVGLHVVNEQGDVLGRIDSLFSTGANDVMVLKDGSRERLVPFVQGPVIKTIDLQAQRMVVAWDAEF